MFFNHDILFRNGPLALLWMAGNEEFKNKKGQRNKEYQAALKTNVVTVCKDLRALFPNMGSAYGLSLKKMGILAKGLGVIYFIKLEQFSRDVYQATISLRRPVTLAANHQIDVAKTKSKTTTVNANQASAVNNNTAINDGFGGLGGEFEEGIPENFGNLDFEEGVFGTPRALPSRVSNSELDVRGGSRRVLFTPPRSMSDEDQQVEDRQRQRSGRKRRRQEDVDDEETMYREVCRKLRGLNENVDAHCMREDDNPNLPEDNGNEFDLGDGMDLFNGADLLNDAVPAPGAELQPPHSQIAGAPTDDGIGPPSTIEYEDSDQLRALETPVGAGTRAQNTRRPRNQGREADESMMELGEVDQVTTPRRIRAVRKRLRLDRKENFTLEEMLLRINAVKDATTMNMLERELVKTRAPGKSEWKYIVGKVDNFIRAAGRPCPSRTLNDMIQEIMSNQVKNREKRFCEPEQNRAIEAEGQNPMSLNGCSVRDRTYAPEPEMAEQGPEAQRDEYEGSPIQGPEMHFGMEVDAEEDFGSIAQHDAELEPEERLRTRKSRQSRNEEQSRLANSLDGFNIFADLFPPRRVTRRKAALAFSMLLKMQAKKEVFLREDEPYGPIRIDRLKG